MFELIKKELKVFFASLSGYLILAFFLIANGLFLWIIPGAYNIPESGMADLLPFFTLAPVLYLFLVPALCMRLFSEEKRSGTLELLLTRPVSISGIVWAKYLAGFLLVVMSILPTIIFPVSLSFLAQPQGFIDAGGIIGSYIGLLFLAGIYVAAGVWASASTENQIVAFLYGVVLSFLLFSGFDFIADIPVFESYKNYILQWGIDYHYEPMSRGVIAFNDVIYFLSVILFFIYLTIRKFDRHIWRPIYLLLVLICVNSFTRSIDLRLDITNDKRYTLSDNTRQLLKDLDRNIHIDIFLAGNLPPGMQKLQYATTRMLEEFGRMTRNKITYELIDPADIKELEEKKQLVQYLAVRGIIPVNFNRTTSDDRLQQQFLFPGLIAYDDSTEVSVNLWKNVPGYGSDENINYSIESLEYELTNAIRLITRKEKKSIAFLTGQGEYDYPELSDMAKTLLHYYHVDFVNTDTLGLNIEEYHALIIAGPSEKFSEKAKYIIDQYVMHGGRILWCLDEVKVNHEALQTQETTYAVYNPLDIEDMLFKYGVRINPDLLIDGNCVRIPVVTGMRGASPEYTPAPWYFSPLLLSHGNHPVTSGIAPVRIEYANSIDTVGGNSALKKTVLLASSEYSALLKTPCPVSLSITEEKMTPEKFNKKNVAVAVMVEGVFQSLYRYNRREEGAVNTGFRPESPHNRMIVISDGDIIRNRVRGVGENMQVMPLGYDEYSDRMYGNRDFILNCINTLCDDEGWMQLRGRTLSMYLLDKTKLKIEQTYWQVVNLLFPIGLVFLGGGLFYFFRRRKYR
ncbi:gliding motility-associated ABC transporter substrate-binding protein GldG [Odoribacter sp. OttesenSCG-928-J03]|nr:gliding motility-associated ABC transporter substrate-binding protein GldG [Odoribacter sp. OttesenSCG-928-J03]MDL2331200.1 gliding motility-associated ABC transporter substrate-binding protein GldG [Odoribacter sp. OttesenSCG-928-A06]